jgi:hypothetical protein
MWRLKMLQKLFNYLFKKQNFNKDLKEMSPDDFISKYLLVEGQTLMRQGLAQEIWDSENKHSMIRGKRQTGKTFGAIWSILYRVLRASDTQRVYIVSYNKSNSRLIISYFKDILFGIQSKMGFKVHTNNKDRFEITQCNKEIIFEVLSLNQYTMRGRRFDNMILFADEIGLFDDKYYNNLMEDMIICSNTTKNWLMVSTQSYIKLIKTYKIV